MITIQPGTSTPSVQYRNHFPYCIKRGLAFDFKPSLYVYLNLRNKSASLCNSELPYIKNIRFPELPNLYLFNVFLSSFDHSNNCVAVIQE